MSANRIVATLRSAPGWTPGRATAASGAPADGAPDGTGGAGRAASPTGVPQFGQKRAPGGSIVPQAAHVASTGVPQLGQKRVPAVSSAPHDRQVTAASYGAGQPRGVAIPAGQPRRSF